MILNLKILFLRHGSLEAPNFARILQIPQPDPSTFYATHIIDDEQNAW